MNDTIYDQKFWKELTISRIKENPNFDYFEKKNFNCRIPKDHSKFAGIVSYVNSDDIDNDLKEISKIFGDRPYYFQHRKIDKPNTLDIKLEKQGYRDFLTLQLRYMEINEENIEKIEIDSNKINNIIEITGEQMKSDDIFLLKKSIFPSTTTTKSRYLTALKQRYEIAEILDDKVIHFLYKEKGRSLGMANLVILGDNQGKKIAFLDGAGTRPGCRETGIYRSLVLKRCFQALESGVDVIYTEARENTSAEILEKFGFTIVDRYSYYKQMGK